MKIKKKITDAVLAANRNNATKSPGPTSEAAKAAVSRNAEKHGLRSRYLRFKDEREKKAYRALLGNLERSIDVDDPIHRIKANQVAINYVRWCHSLQLDPRFYESHSPATTMAKDAIEDSDFLDMSGFGPTGSNPCWECHELSISTRKENQAQSKNGPVAVGSGNDRQMEFHAKFTHLGDLFLRYQRSISRDLDRALREFRSVQQQNGQRWPPQK